MITLMIMTDGRGKYLEESIKSLHKLKPAFVQAVIHDDSGDPKYADWLKEQYGYRFSIYSTGQRSGFAGAYNSAWRWLRENNTNDWIFFTEDDFVYTRHVELSDMIRVMTENPQIVQMALRRQPWNDVERAAGGIVESRPETYTEKTDGENQWLEHRNFFTTNPSLIRATLIDTHDWPNESNSEGKFGISLFSGTDLVSGYWGARCSGEWCEHIGQERAGTGY